MIDIHSHFLPQLDDGAKSWDQTLRMCVQAVDDGIKTIVVTPHVRADDYPLTMAQIVSRREELRSRLEEEGVPLTVLPGAEVFIDMNIPSQLTNGELLTLNPEPLSLARIAQ